MLRKLNIALQIALNTKIETLNDIWNMLRKGTLPRAARYVAYKHRDAIIYRLTEDLGRAPTQSEVDIAISGFVGVIEGLT